ncbi:MAG: PCMD domain-containing protein [Muribaculaceae bacterium]
MTQGIMNAAISVRSGFVAITAVALAAVGLFLPGCIKNDIPYPRIQANIRTFNAEGQSQGSVIDSTARTVTVTFPENVNIYSVDVTGYTLTPGAELLDDPFGAPVDLSVPLPVIVRLYQDYNWLIRAQQTVERYFDIEGQVGATVIDAAARRVVVDVPESMSLSSLHVARAKLGPTGSVMTPDLSDGGIIDATNPLRLVVEAWGHRQSWTIYVRQVTAKVTLSHVEPWTCVAWLSAQAEAGRDNGFEYRLKGDSEWTRLPESEITSNGGSFTGRIIHLDPTTTYEARAYSGEDLSETVEFTTEEAIQPPNMDFDSWWLDGKVWNPWAEDGIPYWDTGNKGATTLGTSNTFPTDETVSGSGWAGRLETRFVGIGTVGKIAAGNIFTGRYVRTDGTNGILAFGREFDKRPTRMRGYLKYTDVAISHVSAEMSHLMGEPDTCIVYAALIDTPEPFEIRTNPRNRQLFDPNGDYVVAYGKVQFGESVSEYTPFEFTLDYRSTTRRPTYIIITASASKYGDYFTGGNGSVLLIDDFELLYDY